MGNRNEQYIYNTEITTTHESSLTKHAECPKYAPLFLQPVPEVPIDKLRAAADKGDHEVILVMTKHIKELREHIAKRKKEEQTHYETYLKSCATELK